MAHHREVGIAVCGIVIGTMLGAGSLVLGRDVTASINDEDAQFVSYRQGFIMENESRNRFIKDNDKKVRPRAEVMKFNTTATPMIQEGTVVDIEECIQKIRYAEEIRAFVIPLIPGRAIDQLVRSSMQDAFDEYEADCISYYEDYLENMNRKEEETGEVEVQMRAPVEENIRHCYKYTGSRRSSCIVEIREKNRQ